MLHDYYTHAKRRSCIVVNILPLSFTTSENWGDKLIELFKFYDAVIVVAIVAVVVNVSDFGDGDDNDNNGDDGRSIPPPVLIDLYQKTHPFQYLQEYSGMKKFDGIKNMNDDFLNEIVILLKTNFGSISTTLYGITKDPETHKYLVVLEYFKGGNEELYLFAGIIQEFEKHLDRNDLSLISILQFRRDKDDFTYNKTSEHALISKFLTRLLQLPEWHKGALTLKKDGVLQQTQSEEVIGFWLDVNADLQINQAQLQFIVDRSRSSNKAHDLIEKQKLNAISKRTLDHDSENDKMQIKRARRPVNNTEETIIEDEIDTKRVRSSNSINNINSFNWVTEHQQSYMCKIKSEGQTRNGKADIANYCELEEKTYENEQETIDEDDDKMIMKGILGTTIEYTDVTKKNFSIYKEKYPDGNLIDLRFNSLFFKTLPKSIKMAYLEEMDNKIEPLVSKNVHDFLVRFFSKKLTAKEWHREIDDLRSPEPNDDIMVALVRVIRRTLPQFIKAFALEDQNPLLNVTTIEGAHLNAFVHPCFDAFLWHISDIHYEYGEITSKRHVNNNRVDEAGYMIDADKFQLIYVEGSRPVIKDDKEINDLKKITNNLKNIFAEIVKDTVKKRKRLPSTLYVFGTDDFEPNINLGMYKLNEVDNANIPRKFSEITDFLLVRDVTSSFNNARVEQRPSRLSFANVLSELD
ncbi:hypothetical protein Glove_529g28 [Diversispora epigaea]|uniref:Uncharacterized protein n=1 Tax=Diversispora epigaea TaxID=1348612 RepID=A0A397GDV8_9GLOM|nr:hypothetical protein Glove_529g28 [Diversispora epigaea]